MYKQYVETTSKQKTHENRPANMLNFHALDKLSRINKNLGLKKSRENH